MAETVPLFDVVTVVGGGTPSRDEPRYWGGEVPWATVKDLTGTTLAATVERITQDGLDGSAAALAPAGSVIVATRIVPGKAAVCVIDVAINQDLKALVPGGAVEARYLLYFLRSIQPRIERMSAGSTVKGITLENLARIMVPLPPLAEQRRIAAVLDKADEIRRKRREGLRLLDIFLRSAFVEMFGDPVKNEMGWETRRLGDLIVTDPQNGLYRPASDYGTGTPIVRIDSFYDGVISDSLSLKRVRIDPTTVDKYGLIEADILINRVNSREYLGKSAIVPPLTEHTVFESNMMRIRVDRTRIGPTYLVALMQTPYFKAQVLRRTKDAVNQASFNQTDLASFEIRVPPPATQHRYAQLCKAVSASGGRARAASRLANALFDSLAQQAFHGEG